MPTAARLVAAICLAVVAVIISRMVMPLMPESTDFGYFTQVNILIGFLSGWVVMGKRAGRGTTAAINNGITGVVVMVFWGLFVHSTDEMVKLAMRNRYDGPFEAIIAVLYIGLDFAKMIFTGEVILTLLIGGVASGLATEYASRKWR